MKIFGIAGWSGSGKTTLLEKLIPSLVDRGLKVSVIKHAHHGFDIDKPGKDSYRHREAGAAEVMLASGTRWALMHECRNEPEPQLKDLVARLAPCDLVLVEGFKQEPVPKLEVFRPANGKSPLFAERDDIVAVACDEAIDAPVPVLDLNHIDAVADFVIRHCQLDLLNQ